QCAGDPEVLLYAERVCLDLVVRAFGEPDLLEHVADARASDTRDPPQQLEVAPCREAWVHRRALDDRADPTDHLVEPGGLLPEEAASAAGRTDETEQAPDRGGL